MKLLAVLIGVFIVVVGLIGVIVPSALLTAADYVTTPMGLYAAAAIRIGIGIVLMQVAPTTRAPRLIRVLGGIAVAAGVITAFVGVDRARAILAWETARGPILVRLGAVPALVFGSFIVFAVTSRRAA